MAINKVVYGNDTLIDVSDTTATESDVLSGKKFTLASGAKGTGSLVTTEYTAGDGIDITNDVISVINRMLRVSSPTANNLLLTDSNGQAIDSGKSLANLQELIDAEIVMTTHTTTTSIGPTPSGWSIQALNSGYTPLMCGHLQYGYSLVTDVGIETFTVSNGSLTLGGFAMCTDGVTRSVQIVARILWKKN